jgi:hypothetical protein
MQFNNGGFRNSNTEVSEDITMVIPEVSETEIITMEDLEIREDSVIRIHSQDQTTTILNNLSQE